VRTRWRWTAVVAACLVVPAAGPGPGADPAAASAAATAPVERARFLMGTRLVIEASGPRAEESIDRAFGEVERLDQVLSNWRDDSEIALLNRAAAEGAVTCSADLFGAVAGSLTWAEKTDGAFDPTVEPLVRRLGLRGDEGRLRGAAPEAPQGPGPDPIGWRLVEIRPDAKSVRFLAPGVGIDFGGIGKGIALDAAAGILKGAGVSAARLDFGGQVLVFGRGPDDGGWIIGLSDPRDRDHLVGTFVLRAGSIATSGNSERAAGGPDGPRSHLLDPRLGAAARFDGSLTVVAPDATSADALSTALFVMGPDRGLAYAADHRLDVLYLRRDRDGALVRRGRGALAGSAPGDSFPTTQSPGQPGEPHS